MLIERSNQMKGERRERIKREKGSVKQDEKTQEVGNASPKMFFSSPKSGEVASLAKVHIWRRCTYGEVANLAKVQVWEQVGALDRQLVIMNELAKAGEPSPSSRSK